MSKKFCKYHTVNLNIQEYNKYVYKQTFIYRINSSNYQKNHHTHSSLRNYSTHRHTRVETSNQNPLNSKSIVSTDTELSYKLLNWRTSIVCIRSKHALRTTKQKQIYCTRRLSVSHIPFPFVGKLSCPPQYKYNVKFSTETSYAPPFHF